MSILTAAGWRSEAAHIKAVVPPQVSFALTLAPLSSSTLMASVLPVRDAIISAVSPDGVSGAFGSAPALISLFDHGRIAVQRRQLHRFRAFAVRRRDIGAGADQHVRQFQVVQRTAQWSAVVPSICGALTSAFCCSSVTHGVSVSLHGRVGEFAAGGAGIDRREQHDRPTRENASQRHVNASAQIISRWLALTFWRYRRRRGVIHPERAVLASLSTMTFVVSEVFPSPEPLESSRISISVNS